MYYTQEQIDRANQADLVLFLQSQGEPLERAGQEYRWKRHDSLTVRGNKWYRHSQSKGGAPIDFVMEFYGKSFTEAVEMLTGEKGAAPPPDRPSPAPLSNFRLPPRNTDNRTARNYLTAARRIDEDVTGFFFAAGDIYEEAAHHNAVFVGRDEDGVPRYAHQRGTAGSFRLDVKGSDKAFNFCYRGEGERLFVFEAPIDLLSFLCLFKKDWQKQSYLALGGVGEKALLRFLSDRPNIKTVYLCLDSDQAGSDACSRLAELVPEGLTVHRLVPLYKDWNEVLQHRAEIADGKYLREAVYGLKEPTQEETVEIIRMSEVDTQTVEWLWEPYPDCHLDSKDTGHAHINPGSPRRHLIQFRGTAVEQLYKNPRETLYKQPECHRVNETYHDQNANRLFHTVNLCRAIVIADKRLCALSKPLHRHEL